MLLRLLPLCVLSAAAITTEQLQSLEARIAAVEQALAAKDRGNVAQELNAHADSPYAALAAAVGPQWLWDCSQCGPATVHFMFGLWDKAADMPDEFQESIRAWARINPSNTIRLWNAEEIKQLWADKFPQHKALWKKTKPIQRADLGRLMILLTYGGYYADLDTRPAKTMDMMLDDAGFRRVQHSAVVCVEDEKTPADMAHTANWPIRQGVAEFHVRIANYFFWAAKGAEFFQRALDLAVSRVNRLKPEDYQVRGAPDKNNPYAIIFSTGPDVITEAAFPLLPDGSRNMRPKGLLIIPENACYVTNKATGTWIGDQHPAWKQSSGKVAVEEDKPETEGSGGKKKQRFVKEKGEEL